MVVVLGGEDDRLGALHLMVTPIFRVVAETGLLIQMERE